MRDGSRVFTIAVAIALAAAAGRAAGPEPAWALWDDLLQRYYDPARGMDYAGLRREERPRLGMMGGMWIWGIVGVLLIVFLVFAILRLARK